MESSIECIPEDEHPLAAAFRLLPTLLHQTGLILLFTICTISAAFCRNKNKVEVIQADKSQEVQERNPTIREADGNCAKLRAGQAGAQERDREGGNADTMMPAHHVSEEGKKKLILSADTASSSVESSNV